MKTVKSWSVGAFAVWGVSLLFLGSACAPRPQKQVPDSTAPQQVEARLMRSQTIHDQVKALDKVIEPAEALLDDAQRSAYATSSSVSESRIEMGSVFSQFRQVINEGARGFVGFQDNGSWEIVKTLDVPNVRFGGVCSQLTLRVSGHDQEMNFDLADCYSGRSQRVAHADFLSDGTIVLKFQPYSLNQVGGIVVGEGICQGRAWDRHIQLACDSFEIPVEGELRVRMTALNVMGSDEGVQGDAWLRFFRRYESDRYFDLHIRVSTNGAPQVDYSGSTAVSGAR